MDFSWTLCAYKKTNFPNIWPYVGEVLKTVYSCDIPILEYEKFEHIMKIVITQHVSPLLYQKKFTGVVHIRNWRINNINIVMSD